MFKRKKTLRFRLTLYERRNYITIERRIFLFWITLFDEDGEQIKFNNNLLAEQYLNTEKKFGETFIIDYRKIIE